MGTLHVATRRWLPAEPPLLQRPWTPALGGVCLQGHLLLAAGGREGCSGVRDRGAPANRPAAQGNAGPLAAQSQCAQLGRTVPEARGI